MNINWKIRVKSPKFWIMLAIAIVGPVLTYFGLSYQDFTTWNMVGETIAKAVQNPYVVGLMFSAAVMTIIDPTTKGVSDSNAALQKDSVKQGADEIEKEAE